MAGAELSPAGSTSEPTTSGWRSVNVKVSSSTPLTDNRATCRGCCGLRNAVARKRRRDGAGYATGNNHPGGFAVHSSPAQHAVEKALQQQGVAAAQAIGAWIEHPYLVPGLQTPDHAPPVLAEAILKEAIHPAHPWCAKKQQGGGQRRQSQKQAAEDSLHTRLFRTTSRRVAMRRPKDSGPNSSRASA